MIIEKFSYDNKVVKAFAIATLFWGIVGFAFGIFAAILLFYPSLPELFFSSEAANLARSQGHLGFGRIRMMHTSTVIYAFVGNGFFVGAYYSMQRLLKVRAKDFFSWFHFWGWQIFILLTLVTFNYGINTSKEYAEHEWPLDILVAIVWLFFGINMFYMIFRRRIEHMYVAIWFYIGAWVAVLILWIFNNLEVALSSSILNPKSYSAYAGVQDALVQWWFGHNAVAFVLTAPILGLMYYYLPKAANRPIFSYKLSIIHFWSLIFVYIWAGPHHLIYTSLPGWTQALGTAFSIMLIAPSWGGMLNGLLTLRGAWNQVRTDPILKMFVVAVTCYGMATFEGPMLATKSLNKIGHYTDWVIAHVHVGTLGWNGFMIFGTLYYIIPKIYQTELHSKRLANLHFWLGTLGMVLYCVPMYLSGFTQGLMWKQFNPDGTLVVKNFLETVTALKDFYIFRAVGGTLYIFGAFVMAYNLIVTVRKGKFLANQEAEAPARKRLWRRREKEEKVHAWLERTPLLFILLSFLVLSIGGAVEILPTIFVKKNVPTISSVKPYSPLELEGRDIYIREGCNACHSQMVRPFRDEVVRYGDYSKAGEYIYDRPFLWGSKRTGPDLHREGGKNPDSWHFTHLYDPRETSPGSIMPRYTWLIYNQLDTSMTQEKLKLMKDWFGVEYSEEQIKNYESELETQAKSIVESIFQDRPDYKTSFEDARKRDPQAFVPLEKREIVAVIAYLQRLGVDIKKQK